MAKYYSTKNYGNDRGLSCCFRQWRSTHSHCSTLHGYSIGIKLIFESETLDDRNWVFDFGGLKAFKAWADYMFDHTLIVANDDPHKTEFMKLAAVGDGNAFVRPHERGALIDLRIVDGVGCEKFAELAYKTMESILNCFKAGQPWTMVNGDKFTCRYPVGTDVKLTSVEVYEHAGNSAVFEG